ncbi:MAG: sulfite exporter TauE/SafE family protein [Patescibacteria group bacterium]
MNNINLLTIFFTGLLTGGLSCLAVQGGLLATAIAQRQGDDQEEKKRKAFPIVVFLLAKLAAYTILGFLLGWFGSLFSLSLSVRVILQFVIAIFMIGTGLSLLNIHPLFRYFIIQPPKFLTRWVRGRSKSADIFSPAILGLMTIFIPCGVTQAMMALAIGSGQAWTGLVIMFVFVLGTIPLFFILGYTANSLSGKASQHFYRIAGVAVIILALYSMIGVFNLAGATWNLPQDKSAIVSATKQEATINIQNSGYYPNSITVKAGEPVTLHLVNDKAYSCAQAFTIPSLGIEKIVRPGTTETIQFTAPSDVTRIAYTCSMGMYRGVLNVVK